MNLLVDCSGTVSLFGTARTYAQRLYDELSSAGFAGDVAIAPNGEAALMLARSHRGVLCAEQADLRTHLASLSTSLLPCELKVHALLRRWGIRTLGGLAALPETGLISRLGQEGLKLQQLARGEASPLLTPQEPEFTLCESLELETPLDDLERLLFALSRLLGEIVAKAVDHAYAVRSLAATLALERGQTHVVRVTPAHPTQNRDALLKLLHLELQAQAPQLEVLAVRLEADPARPQVAQGGLFQSQFPDADRLDLLLTRLRVIAGEQNVGSTDLANSHREDAFTLVAFRPEAAEARRPPVCPLRPALRLLRPPQVVRMRLTDERPHTFFWRGARLKVADAAGPWHASGSWWDRTRFDCDYWDVVTAEPACMLRLQQEHASHAWNVVGLYD